MSLNRETIPIYSKNLSKTRIYNMFSYIYICRSTVPLKLNTQNTTKLAFSNLLGSNTYACGLISIYTKSPLKFLKFRTGNFGWV